MYRLQKYKKERGIKMELKKKTKEVVIGCIGEGIGLLDIPKNPNIISVKI